MSRPNKIITHTRNLFDIGDVGVKLDQLSKVVEIVKNVYTDHSPLNILQNALAFVSLAIDVTDDEIYPLYYFNNRPGWQPLKLTSDVVPLFIGFFMKLGPEIAIKNEQSTAYKISLDGTYFAWGITNDGSECSSYIWIDSASNEERALGSITTRFWSVYSDNIVIMHSNDNYRFVDDRSMDEHMHMPEQLDTLARDVQKFVDRGHARSVLLYGPPGTGKSCGARLITERLGMRSVRIPIMVFERNMGQFISMLRMIRPDALIIDDFDSLGSMRTLLDVLQDFREHVKLIIATVNDIDECSAAMKRPGRFDMIERVDVLDERIVESFVARTDQDWDVIKKWPVAFIREYCVIRDVLGPDRARAEVPKLNERCGDAGDG